MCVYSYMARFQQTRFVVLFEGFLGTGYTYFPRGFQANGFLALNTRVWRFLSEFQVAQGFLQSISLACYSILTFYRLSHRQLMKLIVFMIVSTQFVLLALKSLSKTWHLLCRNSASYKIWQEVNTSFDDLYSTLHIYRTTPQLSHCNGKRFSSIYLFLHHGALRI